MTNSLVSFPLWRAVGLLVGLVVFSVSTSATVKLPRVLGSHMVLQQGMPVPIWGTAEAGEAVTVSFRGQVKTTKADMAGKWVVKLDPLTPGEPAALTVAGANTLVLDNVLVGEVWVGSGQSNIDSNVPAYVMVDPVLREAAERTHPQVRIYRSDVGTGWQETTPAALKQYSAQLFYFGVKLQRELGVPVGLMEGAVQGSPAARWLTDEAVKGSAEIAEAINDREQRIPYAPRKARYDAALAEWEKTVTVLPDGAKKTAKPQMPYPAGVTRGTRGDFYEKHIRPMQPYAIHGVLWDQGEGGTDIHGVPQNAVMTALIASWRRDWGQGEFAWVYQQKPSGGGPAFNPADPVTRGAVALAPLPTAPAQEPGRATHREEYFYFRTVPNAHLVFTSDLMPGVHPENKSGYATRAAQVALGGVYRKPVVYQGPVYEAFTIEGSEMRIRFKNVGKGLVCPTGQGLQGFSITGADRRFYWARATISGADTVVLKSDEVPNPVAARYAWTTTYTAEIPWANLFSAEGLPALSFRTHPEL